MVGIKPIKTHVYMPLSIGGKYKCCIKRTFPYCRLEAGDVFTIEKRPGDYHKLKNQKEFKVEAVRYNLFEGACIVILESKDFKDENELKSFASGLERMT